MCFFFILFFFFFVLFFFFFNDTATTEIYTLSLHDASDLRRHDAIGNLLTRDVMEEMTTSSKNTPHNVLTIELDDEKDEKDDEGTRSSTKGRRRRSTRTRRRLDARFEEWLRKYPERAASYCDDDDDDDENNNNTNRSEEHTF